MFKVGDIVIFKKRYVSNITHQIDFITSMGFVCLDDVRGQFKQDDLQHATPEEIAAGQRIDTNTGVTVMTSKGTSKVKGGMTAFVDMGDDAHLEDHISPSCKTSNYSSSAAQIIAELKAENAILHQAAATHLRNQHHYYELYHNLISQLYPYASDLAEQVGNSNSEYRAGYNRARECAHFNLMEMMESDIEYIKAYCGEGD